MQGALATSDTIFDLQTPNDYGGTSSEYLNVVILPEHNTVAVLLEERRDLFTREEPTKQAKKQARSRPRRSRIADVPIIVSGSVH